MPLTFTSISNKSDWAGSSWVVADDDQLAGMVARVALGQSRYVNARAPAVGRHALRAELLSAGPGC